MFKFYKCPVETHVNTSAKYDIVLYSITKVSGKRAQLFVQMLEKPKRTSSVCYSYLPTAPVSRSFGLRSSYEVDILNQKTPPILLFLAAPFIYFIVHVLDRILVS